MCYILPNWGPYIPEGDLRLPNSFDPYWKDEFNTYQPHTRMTKTTVFEVPSTKDFDTGLSDKTLKAIKKLVKASKKDNAADVLMEVAKALQP